MQNKIFGIYSLLAASAFALTACVGNAPSPETEPTNVSANDSSEQVSTQPGEPSQGQQELGSQSGVLFNSQALDGHRLATPENIPTAPEHGAATSEGKTGAVIADPYTAIPAIVQSIFDYANTLHKAGYTDSASVAGAATSTPTEGATSVPSEPAVMPTVQPQPTTAPAAATIPAQPAQPAQPKAAAMPKDDDWDLPEGFDSKNAFVPIEAD